MIKMKGKRIWYLLIPLIIIVIPFTLKSYYLYLANMIIIYLIGAIGLNILIGYTGQLSLGHAGFFAIGAYALAYLTLNGFSFWLALFIALITAGLFGVLVGLPSLRLRGPYLALVTAGFSEVVRLLINNNNALGSSAGLYNVPKPNLFWLNSGSSRLTWYYFLILTAIIMIYISWRLIESYIGRALMAIKVNETAARASGINTFYFKVFAFTISALYAGLAGCLYASYVGYVSPDAFTFEGSIAFLTMVVLGGLGVQAGPIIGSIFVVAAPDLLTFLGEYKMIFYGIVIVFCMLFLPDGIVSFEKKLLNFNNKKEKEATNAST